MSWHMLDFMAEKLNLPPQVAWDTRHDRRMEWRRLLDEWREGDQARLFRKIYDKYDVCSGCRSRVEFEAAQAEGLIDCTIYIKRDVPKDPTFELKQKHADFVVNNNGKLASMIGVVSSIVQFAEIQPDKKAWRKSRKWDCAGLVEKFDTK